MTKHRANGLRGRGGREDRRKRQRRIVQIKRGGMPLESSRDGVVAMAARSSNGSIARFVDTLMPAIGAYAARRMADGLAEIEASEAREQPRLPYAAGDVVVLTGRVLGAIFGEANDHVDRTWTLRACACELCSLGGHVCTTEWSDVYEMFRHLAKASVKRRGELSADDCSYRGKCPSVLRRRVHITTNRKVDQ